MEILVINADCIRTNTSGNLCHLSYIRGLVELGHNVTLLSSDGEGYKIDQSMKIPSEVKCYTYNGMTLYEKLSLRKNQNLQNESSSSDKIQVEKIRNFGLKTVLSSMKGIVRELYGPHSIYLKFVKKAKKFKSDVTFDFVISISTPASSHLLAYNLLKSGNIKSQKWIQIWEDPWYDGIDVFGNTDKIYKEERKLLSMAEYICYVSPITLERQKQLFPESANKMYWQPLPCYYETNNNTVFSEEKNRYGYFGNYSPKTRNLSPFYHAAMEKGIEVNICGNPNDLFNSTDKIHIHPRMPLSELSSIEDKTNILIFLCNLSKGQIPGKIYQYSATYKTILFILDGTDDEKRILRKYFEKFNRYIFCENTVEDISRAIKEIENGNLGHVKNEPIEDFNPPKIVSRILECK